MLIECFQFFRFINLAIKKCYERSGNRDAKHFGIKCPFLILALGINSRLLLRHFGVTFPACQSARYTPHLSALHLHLASSCPTVGYRLVLHQCLTLICVSDLHMNFHHEVDKHGVDDDHVVPAACLCLQRHNGS